jgi:phage terminase Nu1 subunit (DNA packaging protein)
VPAPILVNAKELATFLKCTYQTVQHLTEKGIIHKAKHAAGAEVKRSLRS